MNQSKYLSPETLLDTDKLRLKLELTEKHDRYNVTHPVLFFNSSYQLSENFAIPQELLSKANQTTESILWTECPTDMINAFTSNFETRAEFLSGTPVLIWIHFMRKRSKLKKGGRKKDIKEKQVKIALSVTLYAVIGRLLALKSIKEKRRISDVLAKVHFIKRELISEWRDLDITKYSNLAELNKEQCFSIFNSLERVGRNKENWLSLYPIGRRKDYSKLWLKHYTADSKRELNQEKDFQKSLVLSLLKLNFVSERKFQAEYEVSMNSMEGKTMSPSLVKQIAGSTSLDHFSTPEALHVAFAGDFNASRICLAPESANNYIETMQLVGRIYRGVRYIPFSPEHISILRQAVENLERWDLSPWIESDDTLKAQAFWAKAMIRTMPISKWKEYFN